MARRKAPIKRETLPDPLYGSDQISKFINVVMRRGKKSIAEKIVYNAINVLTDRLKKESKSDKSDEQSDSSKGDSSKGGGSRKQSHPTKGKDLASGHDAVDILTKALTNVAPTVEVKPRRVGGATYQVPMEVTRDRGDALAMRWVVQAAKGRSEKTMALRLAAELYEAYMGRGTSIKMRDDVHRMAKANQAFAHYRW